MTPLPLILQYWPRYNKSFPLQGFGIVWWYCVDCILISIWFSNVAHDSSQTSLALLCSLFLYCSKLTRFYSILQKQIQTQKFNYLCVRCLKAAKPKLYLSRPLFNKWSNTKQSDVSTVQAAEIFLLKQFAGSHDRAHLVLDTKILRR